MISCLIDDEELKNILRFHNQFQILNHQDKISYVYVNKKTVDKNNTKVFSLEKKIRINKIT